jgi:hypothetical protein
MKMFGLVCLVAFGMLALFIASIVFGWVGRAVEVVQQEVDPGELLRKYQWFKDAAAACDERRAGIDLFDKRVKDFEEQYKGVVRKDWPRDEREQYGQMRAELVGMKAAYNSIAADYNAQMSKINWRFCNTGDLPKGADRPLPREFKPYVTE